MSLIFAHATGVAAAAAAARPARARAVYERALEFFGDELEDETLFVAFAKFEIRCSEVRRGSPSEAPTSTPD